MDYKDVFAALNKRKIRYLVVGGMAVNLYGVSRMTLDLDLLIALDQNNKTEFYSLMEKLGYKTKKPALAKSLMNGTYQSKKIKVITFFRDEFELIDIFIQAPIDFDEAYNKKKLFNIENIDIPTISYEMLIKMKKTRTKNDYGPLFIDPIEFSSKLSAGQRLKWLEQTKKFFLKTMEKSTKQSMLKMRLGQTSSRI